MEGDVVMFGQSTQIVCIDRNQLFLFGGSRGAEALPLSIPKEIVSDLEVINNSTLSVLIETWVLQQKVTPSQLVFLYLPTMYFEKLFEKTLVGEELDTKIRDFFESVPFEMLITKVFEREGKKVAVAINREFFEVLSQVFERLGFESQAIVPSSLIGTLYTKTNFDREMADVVVKDLNTLGELNMISVSESSATSTGKSNPRSHPSRLPLLLSIFGAFIIVLIVLFVVKG